MTLNECHRVTDSYFSLKYTISSCVKNDDKKMLKPYFKLRKNFGKQPLFSCTMPLLLDSILPDVHEQKKYCLRNPVNQETQTSRSQSQHEVNTKDIVVTESGINHVEGGWPKDVSFDDEEQTFRYRRRVERDESYINTILHKTPEFEHYIDQNNAINVYNLYYKGMPPVDPIERPTLRINNSYQDPFNRPVSCIGWTIDDLKFIISYCDKDFPVTTATRNTELVGYMWNLELSKTPVAEFLPPVPCWQVVSSPITPSIIIGGLEDGRVCVFDLRSGKLPLKVSPVHLAHRDPVSALIYINSRLNNEFFSGASDGMCMFWDIRNLSTPIEVMIMSMFSPSTTKFNLVNAHPISTLDFDKSFPTRFLCGTDTGYVVNVNRRGKSHNEIMSGIFSAHNGPVKALHRNPSILKMFITCGDWRVNVWSDEIRTSSIIPGQLQKHQINDVIWAPHRPSSYMSVSADGRFRYWDFLRKYQEPIVQLPLSHCPLLKIKAHENGQLIAVGDKKGALYVVMLSEGLVYPGEYHKPRMVQTYERETRRENILETRLKEIRLKLTKTEDVGVDAPIMEELMDNYSSVESEYKRIVNEEVRRAGMQRRVSTTDVENIKDDLRMR